MNLQGWNESRQLSHPYMKGFCHQTQRLISRKTLKLNYTASPRCRDSPHWSSPLWGREVHDSSHHRGCECVCDCVCFCVRICLCLCLQRVQSASLQGSLTRPSFCAEIFSFLHREFLKHFFLMSQQHLWYVTVKFSALTWRARHVSGIDMLQCVRITCVCVCAHARGCLGRSLVGNDLRLRMNTRLFLLMGSMFQCFLIMTWLMFKTWSADVAWPS